MLPLSFLPPAEGSSASAEGTLDASKRSPDAAQTAAGSAAGAATPLRLELLYAAHSAQVFTLAYRLCRREADAEDILQETFLEANRSLARFRGDGPVLGWLKRIAVTKALMRLRSAGRLVAQASPTDSPDSEAALAERNAHPLSSPDGPIDRVALERALEALPDTSRIVVWLHDVEGYTHEEIAAQLGGTPSFSKSQLARAHARLRASLA